MSNAALASELLTLSRVLYKTRSQHACAKYWQLMDGARRRLGARAGPARRRSARPLLAAAARLLAAQLRRGFFLQLSLQLLASAARLLELTEEDEVGPGYSDTGTAVAREPGALSGDNGKQQLQEEQQQQQEKLQLQQQRQHQHQHEEQQQQQQRQQPQQPQRQQPHQLIQPHQPHQLRQAGRKRAPDAGPASAGPADSGTPFSRGTLVPLGAGRHLKSLEQPSGRVHVGTGPSRDQAPGISSLDASACGDEAAPRGEAKLGSGSGKPSTGAPPSDASGAGPRRQSSGSAAGEGGGASRPEPPVLGAGKLSPDASRQDAPGKAGKTPKTSSKKLKKSAIDDIFGGL